MWTPRFPTRSMRAWRTSTVALASDNARWLGSVEAWKWRAKVASRWFGTSSRIITLRASPTVSTTGGDGQA